MTGLIPKVGIVAAILCGATSAGVFTLQSHRNAEIASNVPQVQLASFTEEADADSASEFLKEFARGDLMEIKMGNAAREKSQRTDVRDFGNRLVQDHTKNLGQLRKLAKAKSIDLPTEISDEQQKTYDRLAKLDGNEWDKHFLLHMLDDHRKDVKEARKEAEDGKDAQVKSLATEMVPVLQSHLDTVEALIKEYKIKRD